MKKIITLLFIISSLSCSKSSDYPPSIQLLQKEVKADPENMKLRFQLAESFAQEEFYAEAELELESLLKQNPHNTDIQQEFINVLLANKKMDQALQTAEAIIEKNPGEGIGYALLGKLNFFRGDYAAASENLIQASQLGNWTGAFMLELLYMQAYCLENLKQEEQAEEIFQKILKENPFHEETLYHLLLKAFRKQSWEEAERYGKLLTSKYRTDFRYPLVLGLAYYHQSKWDLCRSYLRKAYELDPLIGDIGRIAELTDVYQIPEKWNLGLALKHEKEKQYREKGNYIVRGDVLNIGIRIAKDTQVSVDYYNKDHELIHHQKVYLKPRNLMPMQMNSYHITIEDDPEIETAKVATSWRQQSLF